MTGSKEIERQIKRYIQTNENENTNIKILDTAKVVIRGKFILSQAYPKKKKNPK